MRALPPLPGLRAFEAAARHLSFKAAAAELGVTPTAISHQIRSLERYCGQPLFRREPRPMSLTWAGEQLFPVVRDSLDLFSETLSAIRSGAATGRLRITTTNAFAARWLVPRLPTWRKSHPGLRLDIIGTDAVLNLRSGETDVAIRYARERPAEATSVELVRDTFRVVACPSLVGRAKKPFAPRDLARFPLIEAEWPPTAIGAPNWRHWEITARKLGHEVPALASAAGLSFREELHAIEAVLAGQGVAICSDVLVGPELRDGKLRQLSDITLPGYGFYVAYREDHPKVRSIRTFLAWAQAVA